MVAALFDMPSPEFPTDWRHHGRSSGYRYGCRCERCKARHLEEARETASRARLGDRRTCGRCGKSFDRITERNAGTKYCGECRDSGMAYVVGPQRDARVLKSAVCELCATPFEYVKYRPKFDICAQCKQSIPDHIWQQMKTHHAGIEWVRKFVADPHCEICGAELIDRIKHDKGKYRSRLSIDHDHNCCARQVSCGKCIRGYLCHRCNVAIGFMGDDINKAKAALAYLERVSERKPE